MFQFRRHSNQEELLAIQRLRYEVYCREKKLLDPANYPAGLEADDLDECSVHFLVTNPQESAGLLGCFRLILPNPCGFPCERHFHLSRRAPDPDATVEISRLIVALPARTMWRQLLMGFVKETYLYACENGVRDVYAVVDESFFRALKRLGLPFDQIGEKGRFMGETIPTLITRASFEQALPSNNRWFWDYLQAPREDQAAWF